MKKLTLGLLAVLSLAGCATQTYHISPTAPKSAEPNKEVMQTFFVSGIGQEQSIDANAVCGSADNVSRVQTQQSFLNGLLGFVTSGIYTPRQVKVYCK